MVFSYKVRNRYILENINIPFGPGGLTILTGLENTNFRLMGGIITGMFPVEDRDVPPQVEELVKYFTGDLEITGGKVPESAVYLGPDPEKHLFFSRVDEELRAQTGRPEGHHGILNRFGLDERFIKRKISTLSGGEKMKLALTVVFSKSVKCIVLHGVIPWLDKDGKACLIREIKKELKKGNSVVVFEQEIEGIRGLADKMLYYNGEKVIPYHSKFTAEVRGRIEKVTDSVNRELEKNREMKEIVKFDSIRFRYQRDGNAGFILEDVSFILRSSKIYSLVGDNGTGKSTIAKLLLRVERPLNGKIFILKKDLSHIDRAELVKWICFVDQFPEQQITLSSVEQYKKRAQKRNNPLSKRLLERYFHEERSYPIATLSPVELKILSLASSVSTGTKLVIIDEPTWGIDPDGELILLGILLEIIKALKDTSILIISHDINFISRLNAEVLRIKDGKVTFNKDTGRSGFRRQ